MNVVVDTATHQYQGDMKVVYTNKSPETLDKVFGTCSSMPSNRAA